MDLFLRRDRASGGAPVEEAPRLLFVFVAGVGAAGPPVLAAAAGADVPEVPGTPEPELGAG